MTLRIHSHLIIALASIGFSAASMAQMDHSNHAAMAAKPASVAANSALEEAVVKKIDKPAGKVALAHGAQSNGMPAMTMVYHVKDAAWLDKLQVGQKIRFATDPADGGMTVTRFELVK